MKNLVTCLFAICICVTAYTQTTTLNVQESAEFKDKVKSGSVLSMHESPQAGIGVVRISKKNLMFDVFNKALVRQHNSLVSIDKKERYYGDLAFDDVMKVFTVYSPSKQERIVYCHEFNIEDTSHKKTELFRTKVEKNGSLFSGGNKRETGFAMSPNGNYFVVSTDNIKKNSNSYTVRVYDALTLELIYQKQYQNHIEKFYVANDLAIDNKANVYTLGKLYLEGKKRKVEGKANYNFVLNKINADNVMTSEVNVSKEKHISSLIISNFDDEIQLMGFYSDVRAGKIKGTLSFNVNTETLLISESSSFKLPEDVYKDLYNENAAKRKKGKNKEFSNYYVDYVLTDEDGNTYLLAEQFFVTQVYVSTGMNGAGYWQTIYHYNNVLVMKLDSDGNLQWGRCIFKQDNAPSYNAFIKNNKLHVILNSGKNLSEKSNGRVKVSKGFLESSALYDIVFDDNGTVSYDKIQDNKGKTYYQPYYGIYNGERFITISRKGGKKQFLILE